MLDRETVGCLARGWTTAEWTGYGLMHLLWSASPFWPHERVGEVLLWEHGA